MAGAGLPQEIIDAISISNAKSIGEQPAILANLALANQIANVNLAQQQALTAQQAMLQLTMATVTKCVEAITAIDPSKPGAADQMARLTELMDKVTRMGAAPAAPAAPVAPATPAAPAAPAASGPNDVPPNTTPPT